MKVLLLTVTALTRLMTQLMLAVKACTAFRRLTLTDLKALISVFDADHDVLLLQTYCKYSHTQVLTFFGFVDFGSSRGSVGSQAHGSDE